MEARFNSCPNERLCCTFILRLHPYKAPSALRVFQAIDTTKLAAQEEIAVAITSTAAAD